MRFDRGERRKEGEVARDTAVLPRAQAPTALVLALQQGVGNAVVARTLASKLSDGDLLIKLQESLETGQWRYAILALASLTDSYVPICVQMLDSEQRRVLLDELRMIEDFSERERLVSELAKAEEMQPGGQFGKVAVKEAAESTGVGPWAYQIEITFQPDQQRVQCPEIAFVQTTRMSDLGTKKNREYQFPMTKRQNERGEAIDRPAGKDSGFYGYGNDDKPEALKATKTPTFTVKPGSSPKPYKEAWMMDRVTDTQENVKYEFETLVVAKSGPQAGLAYASVHWGFDVDNNRRITPHQYRLMDRPSPGFGTAVEAYNEQAEGLRGKKPSETQRALPDFL